MKHHPIFLTLALIVGSTAIAQDDATVGQNDLETVDPERDTTSEVVQAASPLNDLEWMVGRWIDQGEETTITTDCAWTHGGMFLSRSFRVVTVGEATLDGTQVIGWDPTTGQIRSWTFDSAGGFGTGRWTRDGNRWLVKTSFVLASGERASAINVITYMDPNTMRWQSTNREIAGELQPNIPEVTVVRQPSGEAASNQNAEENTP